MTRSRVRTLLMTTLGIGLFAGCGAGNDGAGDEAASGQLTAAAEAATNAFGAHLPGIDDDEFAEVSEAFAAVEEIEDGLGPIMNERACGNCHFQGALGGGGIQIERRFGRFVNGRFDGLGNQGGSLRQLLPTGSFTAADGRSCTVPLEREPDEATVHNVGRLATPLFGAGLVDAIPDSTFDFIAAVQPFAIRGIPNRVRVLIPNVADENQTVGM